MRRVTCAAGAWALCHQPPADADKRPLAAETMPYAGSVWHDVHAPAAHGTIIAKNLEKISPILPYKNGIPDLSELEIMSQDASKLV
jgi:hypothetical protein